MAVVHRLTAALESKSDEVLEDGTPVGAMLDILRALTRTDGLSAMRDYGARAYEQLPPSSPYRSIACFLEGSAAASLGDHAAAKERLHEGMRLSPGLFPAIYAQCLSQLARMELAEGNQVDADRHIDEMVRILDEHQMYERPPASLCYAVASVVHLQRGQTELGNHERAVAVALLERAEDLSPYQLLGGRLDVALAAILAHDLEGARGLLDDVARRLAWLPETGTLGAAATAIRTLLNTSSTSSAQLVEPLTPAESRVLAYLPTHLSFSEIGAALYVSRNTVKSHAMAIYRKLGVTSRGDAVREARQLRLIINEPVATDS